VKAIRQGKDGTAQTRDGNTGRTPRRACNRELVSPASTLVRDRCPPTRETELRERADTWPGDSPHPEDGDTVATVAGDSDVLPITRPRRLGTGPIDANPRRRLADLRFYAKSRTKRIIGLRVWTLWEERMSRSAFAEREPPLRPDVLEDTPNGAAGCIDRTRRRAS